MSTIEPGPAQLRALSHPARMRILGILRVDGPATATTLAARMGLNTGATSYHLRQLAAHGFIADDPTRGTGRERWWRAVHDSTSTAGTRRDPETDAAFQQAVATTYVDYLHRAVAQHPALPPAWQEVSTMSDWGTRMTAAQAHELRSRLRATIETYLDEVDAQEPEPGALPFFVNVNSFVWPDAQLPEEEREL